MKQRVAVIGQGYVGLPLALTAVRAGHVVFGVENSDARARRLAASSSYIDDVSDRDLREAHESGRYSVVSDTTELRELDVVVITVPTPLDGEGRPDLRFVLASIGGLRNALHSRATVVVESTTFPGTTEEIIGPVLERVTGRRIGSSLHLGFSPERVDPGNPAHDARSTPKLVSGVTSACLDEIRGFYASLGIPTVDVSGTREAEFAKLLENTFRLVNIGLVNELAEYGHKRGIDVREAIRAASTKPFGYMAFSPGPGVGGHCIPIDPHYLAWDANASAGMGLDLVESAYRVNERRPDYIAGVVSAHLDHHGAGAVVIVIGAAYKPGIADVRESPAISVVAGLRARGHEVVVYDPVVGDGDLGDIRVHGRLSDEDIRRAAIAVLVTDHGENDYSRLQQAGVPIIDTRGRLGRSALVTL
ncbi:nucleotide sugar dehydrogenase [Clavibacter sp. VKM Ac-2872]|uniref:nucleotide sugar dehydrogenase n=1 Tax=Clavibacter sp. VKM Ac-2872 TaxID=2783812 RepID=UPI00188D0280|nr:nucleotide sugar dehydrogenase [Clavibacter sp. VKM Ac-2872]MBF4622761.1 nucleotide sugar dehydrogenase [Clavibacter sp. VKM Ac-2872]